MKSTPRVIKESKLKTKDNKQNSQDIFKKRNSLQIGSNSFTKFLIKVEAPAFQDESQTFKNPSLESPLELTKQKPSVSKKTSSSIVNKVEEKSLDFLSLKRNKVLGPNNKVFVKHNSIMGTPGELLKLKNIAEMERRKSSNKMLNSLVGTYHDKDYSKKTIQLKVAARFRPLNDFEKELKRDTPENINYAIISEKTLSFNKNHDSFFFTFDRVFDVNSTQEEVFNEMGREAIESVMKGYNSTVFAYGQSGSGKTHTMYGSDINDPELKGLVPRIVDYIFDYIDEEKNKNIKFEIKFSLLEIYKEKLYDLLNPGFRDHESCNDQNLKIKESATKGVYVSGLTEEYISDLDEFFILLEEAEKFRVVSETYLNKTSSRSHLLLKFEISQSYPDGIQKKGILNLVDLAGSEKVSKTGAQGETLEEAKKINLSLSALGNVISSLAAGNDGYVPYRDSKLTRILQDSLAGNFKTTLIVTCSPHFYNAEESLSTLNFAQRAKKIKTTVGINVKRSPEELEKIILKLNEEIRIMKDKFSHVIPEKKDSKKFNYFAIHSPSDDDSYLSEESSVRNCFSKEDTILRDGGIMFPNANFSDTLKIKEEEIRLLKEEITELKEEVIFLKKKLDNSLYEKSESSSLLVNLENLLKLNIDELKNINLTQKNIFSYENEVLDKNLKELEQLHPLSPSYLEDLNYANIDLFFSAENIFDIPNRLKKFKLSMKEIQSKFNNLMKEDLSCDLINSFQKNYSSNVVDNFISSYDEIFNNCRLFTGKLLDEIITKKKFENEKTSQEDGVLKNTVINLSILNIGYERIIFRFLNKLIIDSKKFLLTNIIKIEQNKRFDGIVNLFDNIIDLIKEIKTTKFSEEPKINLLRFNPPRNIIRPISKRSSFIKMTHMKNSTRNLPNLKCNYCQSLTSTFKMSINEQQLPNNMQVISPIDKIKKEESDISSEDDSKEESLDGLKNSHILVPGKVKKKIKRLNTISQPLERNDIKEEDENTSRTDTKSPTRAERRNMEIKIRKMSLQQSQNLSNISDVHQVPNNQGIFNNNYNNYNNVCISNSLPKTPEINENERTNQLSFTKHDSTLHPSLKIYPSSQAEDCALKLIKKELNVYKSYTDILKKENQKIKFYNNEVENSKNDLVDCIYSIPSELKNFQKCIIIIKGFYEEEIKEKISIIESLSSTLDEVLMNKNAIFENSNDSSKVLQQYFDRKKDLGLKKNNQNNDNLNNIVQSYLEESGCATKKMDYINFIGDFSSKDHVKVDFGVGLHSKFPGVSPLIRKFKIPFKGDQASFLEMENSGDLDNL